MGKYERKRKRRLPIHVILGYLLLATVLLTGVTVSKYVTSTSGGDQARVASFGDLELTEKDKPERYIVTPGVPIEKNPVVNFGISKKSETSAYVFVKVIAPQWNFDKTENAYTAKSGTKEVMSWSIAPGWTRVYPADDPPEYNDNTNQVFYQYVQPGQTLVDVPVIKDGTITVSENLYRSDYQTLSLAEKDIKFEAYAVQANGFGGPVQAWWDLAKSLPNN